MKNSSHYQLPAFFSWIANLVSLNLFAFYFLHIVNKFNQEDYEDYISAWLIRVILLLLLAIPLLDIYLKTINIIHPNKYNLEVYALFIGLIFINSIVIAIKQNSLNKLLVEDNKIDFYDAPVNNNSAIDSIVTEPAIATPQPTPPQPSSLNQPSYNPPVSTTPLSTPTNSNPYQPQSSPAIAPPQPSSLNQPSYNPPVSTTPLSTPTNSNPYQPQSSPAIATPQPTPPVISPPTQSNSEPSQLNTPKQPQNSFNQPSSQNPYQANNSTKTQPNELLPGQVITPNQN